METHLTIPIPGTEKVIYAVQRGSLDSPVIVLVHGLTNDMQTHLFYNAARVFEDEGFSTLRFNLYDWREDARKLHDCTFTTYAEDIATVVGYLKDQGASTVFGVGHSYGGVAVLKTASGVFDAVSLWEPTHYGTLPKDFAKQYSHHHHGITLMSGAFDFVIPEALLQEIAGTNWQTLSTSRTEPFQVIVASDGLLVEGGQQYVETAGANRKELVVIEGADHSFCNEGNAPQLYKETVRWFKNI